MKSTTTIVENNLIELNKSLVVAHKKISEQAKFLEQKDQKISALETAGNVPNLVEIR